MAINVGSPRRAVPLPETRTRRPGAAALVWLLGPALLAAAALGAFVLYASMTASKPQASGGLPWGGIRLYAPLQVKSWVQGHGGSYARWQKRHPAALAIVAPKAVQRAQPGAAKAKHAPAAKRHRSK